MMAGAEEVTMRDRPKDLAELTSGEFSDDELRELDAALDADPKVQERLALIRAEIAAGRERLS